MPDLERMTAKIDCSPVIELLDKSMKKNFYDRRLWHGDPAWPNIAVVRNSKGTIPKACMIDLEPQHVVEKKQSGAALRTCRKT